MLRAVTNGNHVNPILWTCMIGSCVIEVSDCFVNNVIVVHNIYADGKTLAAPDMILRQLASDFLIANFIKYLDSL